MFGIPAPCEIAINGTNAKETGGLTYHLQVQVRAVVLRQILVSVSPHYPER